MDYAIAAFEDPQERPAPVPAPLLAQARLAARGGVPLDTVVRRYVAGHALLGDLAVSEVEGAGVGAEAMKRALRVLAAMLDHLLAAVAAEYRAELEVRARSSHRRRAECVERLLAGRHADTEPLDYEMGGWHIGVLVVGGGVEQLLRELAVELDCRLLFVADDDGSAKAWLGSRLQPASPSLAFCLGERLPAGVRLAVGEPGRGIGGWRLTHQQAAAALPIALRGPDPLVLYADVALLAAALQDQVLVGFLRDSYVEPIEADRCAPDLRDTLRAYFAAEHNVSSAAAALGISRQAVAGRLRRVESRLGRPVESCRAELEVALRLREIGNDPVTQGDNPPALPPPKSQSLKFAGLERVG